MKEKIPRFIEALIIVLIISDILLLTYITFFNANPKLYSLIVLFDLVVVLILIPEFIYRLWKSENRREFLKHNWTDILGMLPEVIVGPISVIFRYFRLIRIVRILALFKKDIRHIFEFLHKSKIDYGIFTIVLVLIIGSILFYILEVGVNNKVTNYYDALWYLLVTITTVGYGDISPFTNGGRLVGAMVMFVGIGFISFLTATITAFFVRNKKEPKTNNLLHEKLDNLQNEITELKEIIKKDNKKI